MNKRTENLPVVIVMLINVALLASLYVNLSQAFQAPVL